MLEAAHVLPASSITLATAERALVSARAEAVRLGVNVSIAVLDRGGQLLAFARMDGVHTGTVDIAIAKARTAVLFNRPTAALATALSVESLGLITLPGIVAVAGGVPFVGPDGLAGAVGVSGSTPQNDEQIAAAGAALTGEKA